MMPMPPLRRRHDAFFLDADIFSFFRQLRCRRLSPPTPCCCFSDYYFIRYAIRHCCCHYFAMPPLICRYAIDGRLSPFRRLILFIFSAAIAAIISPR